MIPIAKPFTSDEKTVPDRDEVLQCLVDKRFVFKAEMLFVKKQEGDKRIRGRRTNKFTTTVM